MCKLSAAKIGKQRLARHNSLGIPVMVESRPTHSVHSFSTSGMNFRIHMRCGENIDKYRIYTGKTLMPQGKKIESKLGKVEREPYLETDEGPIAPFLGAKRKDVLREACIYIRPHSKHKTHFKGWRDASAVKSTDYSYRSPGSVPSTHTVPHNLL